jgi:carbonic anhydrase
MDEVHWSYKGDTGPAHWGELTPAFATCGTGRRQSPIDIVDPIPKALPPLDIHYESTVLNVINNGHAIQADVDPGSYIVLDGVRYDLLQFHFHTLSEHMVAGEYSVMEMHLVHRSAEDDLAVIGVWMDEAAANPALAPIWGRMPQQAGPAQLYQDVRVNPADLLPASRQTYRYSGSLTTPPCSEDVKWVMMVESIPVSADQVKAFARIFPSNNRPVQPLNGREVFIDVSS